MNSTSAGWRNGWTSGRGVQRTGGRVRNELRRLKRLEEEEEEETLGPMAKLGHPVDPVVSNGGPILPRHGQEVQRKRGTKQCVYTPTGKWKGINPNPKKIFFGGHAIHFHVGDHRFPHEPFQFGSSPYRGLGLHHNFPCASMEAGCFLTEPTHAISLNTLLELLAKVRVFPPRRWPRSVIATGWAGCKGSNVQKEDQLNGQTQGSVAKDTPFGCSTPF